MTMVTWRVRAFTVLSLMIYHCVLSCVFGVSDNSVASVRTLRGKSAHNLLDNTIDHTDEANDLESLSSLSSLSSSSSSSFHTSDHDYIDRYRTCFGCKIILSSSVTNKNLYDSSSLVAIMSSILRIMDEKEDSITYNRDPSKLCSYSDAVSRPIEQGVINFSIRKELIQPTYTWGYEEMVSFMKNQIETSITSGAFQDIILEDIITYNATLLQYGQFERILSRVTTSSVTIDSVQETLSRPTHEPTGMPTFQPSLSPTLNISNYVSSDTKGSAYYARRIVPLCVMGFFIALACFVLLFIEPPSVAANIARELEREEMAKKQAAMGLLKPIEDEPLDVTHRVLPPVCYEAAPEAVNRAFIYLKPHCAGVKTLPAFIRHYFESNKSHSFRVVGDGHINAKWAHDGFEKQYHKMYKISFLVKPNDHDLTMKEKEKFFMKFCMSWETAVNDVMVKNVPDTCSSLQIDQNELGNVWMACVEKGQMAKLNDSFYIGLIDFIDGKQPIFCINGFFMSIRAEYLIYATPMPYFLVEWSCTGGHNVPNGVKGDTIEGTGDSKDDPLSWKSFNKSIIGAADPQAAHAGSLRACINDDWESIGLTAPLSLADNAIHASSSAFEALAERTQWLDAPTFSDPLGYALNILGVTPDLLAEWLKNPEIKGQPVFDHFKSLDCKESIEVAYKLLIWDTATKNGVSQEAISKTFHEEAITSRNCAFMYIKPHANNFTTQTFVRDYLKEKNFIITLEGEFDADYMTKAACIDKQYADMARTSLTSPTKLDLPEEKLEEFEKVFGITWESALEAKRVLGVTEAAEFLDLSDTELSAVWIDISLKNPSKILKLERSVYCCLVDNISDKEPIFSINGFFMGMRSEYTTPPASVHYFLVEWSSSMFDWSHYRSKIIGSCNPYEADEQSLRGLIAQQWLILRQDHPLDAMHNAIHASSSAFESCTERSIWFKNPIEKDTMFGQKLISSGIPPHILKEWALNPRIFDKCVFDYMMELDSAECIAKAKVLLKRSNPGMDIVQRPQTVAGDPTTERRMSTTSSSSRGKLIIAPRLSTPHPTSGITTVAATSRRRTAFRKQPSASQIGLPVRGHAKVIPMEISNNPTADGGRNTNRNMEDMGTDSRPSSSKLKQNAPHSRTRNIKKVSKPSEEEVKEEIFDRENFDAHDHHSQVDDDERIQQTIENIEEQGVRHDMKIPDASLTKSYRSSKLAPLVTAGLITNIPSETVKNGKRYRSAML